MKYSTSKGAFLVDWGFMELRDGGQHAKLQEKTTGIKEQENQAGVLERKGMVEKNRAG